MKHRGLRRLIALASAALLVAVGSVPTMAAGTAPNLIPVQINEAMVFLAEEDADFLWGSRLALQPPPPDANFQRLPWIWCPTIDDPVCDFNKPGYGPLATLSMPRCESATAEDCIETVSFFKGTESMAVEYFGEVPGQQGFAPDAKTQLPRGGISPIFRVPSAPHSGGDFYMVSGRSVWNYTNQLGRFSANDFNLFVIPISIEDSSNAGRAGNTISCIWATPTACAVRQEFPAGIRVGVEIRATNEIGGWFLGRMQSPNIQVAPFSPRNNRITVEAAPVEVARFAYKAAKSEFSLEDLKATGNSGVMGNFESNVGARIYNTGYDTSNFGLLKRFRERVKDTAVGTTTHWGLRTTSRESANSCLADRTQVLGIVSTNSMVYDGFAPAFKDGFLDYRVAGLHLMPDGKTPVVGTYDLVMRSDTARCLYGFSKAPVSATITITGTGDLKVATTIVSERDGWLKLAAYGFTFSEKEIKVNITQPVVANPLTINLARFTGTSTRLSMSQRYAIEDFIFASTGTTTVNCTALFVKASDRTRALTRARAACNYAKSLGPAITVEAKQTKTKSLDGRVVLQSR
jgi:hypothetical protein